MHNDILSAQTIAQIADILRSLKNKSFGMNGMNWERSGTWGFHSGRFLSILQGEIYEFRIYRIYLNLFSPP